MPERKKNRLALFWGGMMILLLMPGLAPTSLGSAFDIGPGVGRTFHDVSRGRPPVYARRDGGPSSGQERMNRQFEEWQSLSPEEKKRLRRRMERWKQMPPQQRNLYKKRYQQLQKIDPAERRQLEEKIFRWDNLSPEEQDQIRMKFR